MFKKTENFCILTKICDKFMGSLDLETNEFLQHYCDIVDNFFKFCIELHAN